MNYRLFLFASLISMTFFATSCNDDENSNASDDTTTLELNFEGLEDLGPDYTYEGWIIVDGNAISTGVFTVDEAGNRSKSTFDLATEDVEDASTFVLTIEPSPDPDPAPSSVHILGGDFNGATATLSIGHETALGDDFSASSGDYILATPTDTDDSNEASGIWFLNNSTGSPATGLSLPTLPAGWAYEGWVVIDGIPVTTGTFTDVAIADNASPYSGPNAGPPFPGEDFLTNAPAGLSFPTDLSGGTAVISIEPVPDNSPNPFTLKPLVGPIPETAPVHSVLSVNQNLIFPTGSVNR